MGQPELNPRGTGPGGAHTCGSFTSRSSVWSRHTNMAVKPPVLAAGGGRRTILKHTRASCSSQPSHPQGKLVNRGLTCRGLYQREPDLGEGQCPGPRARAGPSSARSSERRPLTDEPPSPHLPPHPRRRPSYPAPHVGLSRKNPQGRLRGKITAQRDSKHLNQTQTRQDAGRMLARADREFKTTAINMLRLSWIT